MSPVTLLKRDKSIDMDILTNYINQLTPPDISTQFIRVRHFPVFWSEFLFELWKYDTFVEITRDHFRI